GSHTITPILENPDYFNISPTSFTVGFPTQTSPFTQDFCVTANGLHSDVEVVILPILPARPGFDALYKIVFKNKGSKIENGTINFTFDDAVLDYVLSNPVYNTQSTNTFTWNYSNLLPFETREIEIVLNVNSPFENPAINNGDQLNFLAQITPLLNDEVVYDNTFTLKQIVVGSYDPNDKTCLEGEIVGPDKIGEYVHYLIRFENTGTYPAENIVVKDMIDLTKFDITTLVPLKGSHEFYTRINNNKVEFIFENINLDFDDTTNDGYVAFKIKTKTSLALGDTFTNNASIYFDYNFPITTNTYATTIEALKTSDFDFGSQFALYPNPVKETLYFKAKEATRISSVEIYNLLGQIVLTVPNTTTSVDVSELTKGNYFVKLNTEKGSTVTKFIKE
ncbi:T9SS type A sorting domain-containing protein, partial [Flavobacterium sp. J27]|uniref:T9SS type A sorting domain-containing protein n=1 Tax=Flavobacterium sp. J27 TaxID=2060419 RepID=UPI001030023A